MGNIVLNFFAAVFILGLGHSMGVTLRFYSDESSYIKLEDENNQFNYTDWKKKCGAIGGGYKPAVIKSITEFKFILANIEAHIGDSSVHSFWVGGSTSDGGNGLSMQYFDYQTIDTGYRRVTIEFDPCGNSSDSHVYQLKSKPASDLQPAMLCEDEGDSFQSDTSLYRKLGSSTKQSRDYWTAECAKLGPGWIPAVLNSELEYNYIEEEQRALMNRQDYFISGATRTTGIIEFENYLPYQIGNDVRTVYVSTLINGTHDNENFQIMNSAQTQTLNGILCENDGLLYQSDSSHYRRLSSNKKFNYPFWEESCLELGTGWGPASADDAAEFDFIQEKERISPDDRSYWIERWFNDTLESRGYSEDTHAWLMSKDFEGKGFTNDLSTLEVQPKSVETFGILCECSKTFKK